MAAALSTAVRQSLVRPSVTAYGIEDRIDHIRACPLFCGLSEQAYGEIAWRAQPSSFGREQLLFMQGATVRDLMLIRSGSVSLSRASSDGVKAVFWMHGPGSAIGVVSEPASCYHTCSARAIEPCTVLAWNNEVLQNLVAAYPELKENMRLMVASRQREQEKRLREEATANLIKRYVVTLLGLVRQMGRRAHGGVELSLSRGELAQATGRFLFNISRLLSKWGELGFA
jgi:CRP-like cAMP-binding protein